MSITEMTISSSMQAARLGAQARRPGIVLMMALAWACMFCPAAFSQTAYNLGFTTGTTGTTVLWNTTTTWNPAGTPGASDTIAISQDLLGTTNIDYATGSSGTVSIASITVTDTSAIAGSGAFVAFRAGVAGSALQFSTTTPSVSTNIVNVNSLANQVTVQNPLFQAGSTFTKGGVGNVRLELLTAASGSSFSSNVTSLSGTGGNLWLRNATGATMDLPTINFDGTGSSDTGLAMNSGSFTATGKTLALGSAGVALGGGGALTLQNSSTFSGGQLTMGSNNSNFFYLNGGATLTVNDSAATFTNLFMGETQANSATAAMNVQSGTASFSGTGFMGNPNNTATATQTMLVNVSGGLMRFTKSDANWDFEVGRDSRGSSGGVLTMSATVSLSGSGTLDMGTRGRLMLGRDTSASASNVAGVVALNGGMLRTAREITRGGNTGTGGTDRAQVFLNSGTLQATAAIADLFTGFTGANDGVFVSSGGAVIDTGAFAVGVSGTLLANPSSAGGGLTKLGSGTLTLSGSTGYTGVTTLSAGVLAVGSANALAGGGNLAFSGGSLQFGAANQADYSARIKSSTGPVSIDTNAQSVTFASDVDSTNVGGLTKLGTGTLALTAANTYSGTTTISAGALSIGSGGTSGSISSGPIANAATLIVNRSDAVTLSSAMSGTGALIVRGTGPLTLSGANMSTGNTTLETGASVSLGAGSSIGTGALAFTGPAIPSLNLGGNSQTVSSFTIASATAAYSTPLVTNGAFTISSPGSSQVDWGNQPAGTVYDFSGLTSFAYNAAARAVRFITATSGTNSMRLASGSNTLAFSSLQVGGGPNANAPTNSFELLLGQANTFNLGNSLTVGSFQGRGVIQFQSGLSSPTVRFRGADGGEDSRLPAMTIGYTNSGNTSGGGTVDLTAGTVDAKVTGVTIGESLQNTVATSALLMSSGTFDASTIVVGLQTLGGNANAQTASLSQSGGVVTSPVITLGNNVGAGTPRFVVAYNLAGGTLRTGSFVSGTGSAQATSSRTLAWSGGSIGHASASSDIVIDGSGTSAGTGLLSVSLSGTATKTLVPEAGRSITIGANALVSGVGVLTVNGPGTVVLSGSNSYSGGTTLSAGTLRAGAAGAFGSGAVSIAAGATLDLDARPVGNTITNNGGTLANAASYAGSQTLSGSSLFGNLGGSLAVASGGLATFTGAMSGAVTINNGGVGTLASTGTLGNGAAVLAGGRLAGIGTVAGGLSGGGSIDPGNSPGILTAGFVNPTGGLDFNFEFTAPNAPDWANAAASLNDVQRLIDATPFSATLTSANVINVYLDVASIDLGDTFQGGFFTDTAADFDAMVADATYNVYYRGDGQGSAVAYGGTSYYLLAAAGVPGVTGVTRTAVQVPSADFAGGTVTNGYTMQFVVVPEPGALALVGMGAVTFAWVIIRRRIAGAV